MTNLIRSNFQAHPFHLVSPSPWPIYTCISLLTLTTTGVLTMHGFSNARDFFFLALITLISSMSFWFRDIISEGTNVKSILPDFLLNIPKAIHKDVIKIILDKNKNTFNISEVELGYYLAGLLESDGCISLPFWGNTVLNGILNPKIVFTSHIKNISLYAYIQQMLGGAGHFQKVGLNGMRYIIGDIKEITLFINIVHGKLRTPKNKSFNQLIEFIKKNIIYL